jgi:D-arginine utilization repressor
MSINFDHYKNIAHGLVLLFKPWVEVVIHDLSTGKIIYIKGALSSRNIGAPSLIEEPPLLLTPVYEKKGVKGRIKSISIPLQNLEKSENYLMCINVDLSSFDQVHSFLNGFLVDQSEKPKELFEKDWKEHLNDLIHDYLKENHLAYEALNKTDKKKLIHSLKNHGAFKIPKAADYIAGILQMGRATIFNYLKEINKNV